MRHSRIILLVGMTAALLLAAQFAFGQSSTPATKRPAAVAAGAAATGPATGAPAKDKVAAPATKAGATPAAKGKDPAAVAAPTPAATTPAKPPIPMPPEPPPMSKTPPDGLIDLGEAGKIMYKDQPTPIIQVFMLYRQAQVELKYLGEKEKVVRSRQSEVNLTQTLAKKEATNQESPLRVEMSKLRNKEREVRKTLSEDPPKQPIQIQMPPAPARSNTNYGSSSSYGGYSGSSNNDNGYSQWQQRCQQIQQQNAQNQKKYQQDMKEFKDKQAKAKAEIADLATKVKDLDTQIDSKEKDFDTKNADTVTSAKDINDALQSIARQTTVATSRLEALADALRGAPENVRLGSAIVEWEEAFYIYKELKAQYDETQGAINAVRDQLKEDAEKAGKTFAADWRHPQQDRMDALKAVLEKAQAVMSAGVATKAKA